jgi:hypothetical protein
MNGRRGKAPRDHGNRGRKRIGIHIRGKHGGATAYYHRLEREWKRVTCGGERHTYKLHYFFSRQKTNSTSYWWSLLSKKLKRYPIRSDKIMGYKIHG